MKPFKFVQLADTQFGLFAYSSGKTDEEIAALARRGLMIRPAPLISGFQPEIDLFTKAVGEINQLKPSFAVLCGDIGNQAENCDEFEAARKIAKKVNNGTDFHWVAGNHDVAADGKKPEARSLLAYREKFGKDYYDFRVGDVAFTVINSTVLSEPGEMRKEADEQIEFIASSLERAQADGARLKGVFSHHPPFMEHPDEADSMWNISLGYREKLLELLFRYKVDAVFAGHLHRNHTVNHGALQIICSAPVGYPLADDPSGYTVVEAGEEGFTFEFVPLGPPPDNSGVHKALSG